MKRSIKLNFTDEPSKELILSKATLIKTNKEMINLEKLEDGTWRLIWSEGLIPNFSKLLNLEIVREN